MLETVHEEDKAILTLLILMDKGKTKEFSNELVDNIDAIYDKYFYGE